MKKLISIYLIFLVVACAGIPTESLNTYRASFDSFHSASDEFLIQFGQTTKKIEKRKADHLANAAAPYQPYPKELPAVEEGGNIDPNVAAMRRALQVISRYNATLISLAEGTSIKAVGNTASGLVHALNGLAGIALPANVGGLVSTVAQELERARLRKEFRNALDKGAPIIAEMFNILKENIDTHYENNFLFANEERIFIVADIIDQVTALQDLIIAYKAPEDEKFKSLQDRQQILDNILAPVSLENFIRDEYPYPLKTSEQGKEWDGVVDSSVTASIEQISQKVELYSAGIERMKALGKTLAAYRQMLVATNSSLTALVKADKIPPKLLSQADYILNLAFQVKQHLAEIRSAEVAAK